jgi:cell wall-associated NlpC family hydrolase
MSEEKMLVHMANSSVNTRAHHDAVSDCPDNCVAQQEANRSAVPQGVGGTKEEPCSNDTPNAGCI